MIALSGLFLAAFAAATIFPFQSEAVLAGLLVAATHPATLLIAVATLGNVLGSVVNWVLGRYLLVFRDRRWFPASASQLDRAQAWYGRYGRWSLLGSWLPVIGDPLTVVAGLMREPLPSFLLLVTIAKGARYILLAAATLAWL
ncbi:membrane protein YqaA, SNARE-associated domain [Roseovarius litoreus]|jgi:membrane protein YqaA with SNARE-associated domain|uniref:Membrane protein YqaA, SNARE-associated domain n=1 Tax=Roseovarius litoreus TaxID=1155722 RepID=A0A1M7IRI0_9RHOB|nr:YqaA family protein [Roseovarius litoreus]SHM43218.1 membrane protein YqaA, SNARE-associated domain [Roseovarius litoreus]